MIPVVALTILVRWLLAYFIGLEVADVSGYRLYGLLVLDQHTSPYASLNTLCPYPPLWLPIPAGTLWLSRALDVRFDLLMRCWSIAGDAVTAAVLWKWVHRYREPKWELGDSLPIMPSARTWRLVVFGWALNPVSLMVTGLQGNFMPVALACAVTAAYLTDRGKLEAGALVLGLGIGLRSWPVLLLPFLVRGLSWREIYFYTMLAMLPVAVSAATYSFVAPATYHAMFEHVFTYHGTMDMSFLGIARAWWYLHSQATLQNLPGTWGEDWLEYSKFIFLAAAAALALFSWYRPHRLSTAGWCACILLLDLALVGGVAVQYLIWPLPFLLVEGLKSRYTLWTALATATFSLTYFPPLLFGAAVDSLVGPTPWWSRVEIVAAMCVALTAMWLTEIKLIARLLVPGAAVLLLVGCQSTPTSEALSECKARLQFITDSKALAEQQCRTALAVCEMHRSQESN